MCSREECDDRERFGEVSVFECDHHVEPSRSSTRPPNRRRLDPRLAVSKYRRSAAGSSAEGRYPVRTLEQLATVVEHLLDILAEQRAPPPRATEHNDEGVVQDREPSTCRRRETMKSTVSFVEDRLRAVQVDLVKLRHPESSRGLQVRMARCHVLILYLMADTDSYEATFGCASLQTALASYVASPSSSSSPAAGQGHPDAELEEILSYAILFAVRQDVLEAAQRLGSLLNLPLAATSTALAGHRIHLQARRRMRNMSPPGSSTLRWTMALLSQVVVGHWHLALRHLGPNVTARAAAQLNGGSDRVDPMLDLFVIRARCLLAPCLQHMRLEALKSYNASFAKGEAVPASDVARLLQMPPFTSDDDVSSGPAKSTWDTSTEAFAASDAPDPRENCDAAHAAAVRFGRDVGLGVDPNGRLLFHVASSPALRAIAGRNVRNEEDCLVLQGRDGAHVDIRIDQDGVRMPSPAWMRQFTG